MFHKIYKLRMQEKIMGNTQETFFPTAEAAHQAKMMKPSNLERGLREELTTFQASCFYKVMRDYFAYGLEGDSYEERLKEQPDTEKGLVETISPLARAALYQIAREYHEAGREARASWPVQD